MDAQSSLVKALKIIECFNAESPCLRLAEIASRVNIHRSTAYRLLSDLVSESFLEFDKTTKQYRLGIKFLSFAAIVLGRLNIIDISKPIMKELVEKTSQTVNLAILDQNSVVYVAKVEPPSSLRLSSRVGARVPVHCTALGKVLLAYLHDDDRQNVLKNVELKEFTPATIISKEKLLEELANIKREGFAIDHEEYLPGLMCVAYPIFNYQKEAIAAISIAGPVTDFKEELLKKWEKYIGKAATEISHQLGYK